MSETAHIDIDYVARLARIELSEEERQRFAGQLERILEYFECLKEIDLEGVEPMAHASPQFNVWADDVVEEAFAPERALANAPAGRAQQFVVPKVVEDA